MIKAAAALPCSASPLRCSVAFVYCGVSTCARSEALNARAPPHCQLDGVVQQLQTWLCASWKRWNIYVHHQPSQSSDFSVNGIFSELLCSGFRLLKVNEQFLYGAGAFVQLLIRRRNHSEPGSDCMNPWPSDHSKDSSTPLDRSHPRPGWILCVEWGGRSLGGASKVRRGSGNERRRDWKWGQNERGRERNVFV